MQRVGSFFLLCGLLTSTCAHADELTAAARWAAWRDQQNGSTRFTDWLRAEAGADWDSIVHHPFTDMLANGTLPDAILIRYLVQDHRFLDSFVILLASMVAAAPSLPDRIPGAQLLGLVTGKENTYFERSFESLGVTADDRHSTPDAPVTQAFDGLMRRAAQSGSLGQMLAVLVVAEWSYASWGERVLPTADRHPDLAFDYREWIDLHSGPYFAEVVNYLRSLLDKVGPGLTDAGIAETRAAFLEAVTNENAFWAMAMGDGGAMLQHQQDGELLGGAPAAQIA